MHFHRWGKWAVRHNLPQILVQERECAKCGKVQFRREWST